MISRQTSGVTSFQGCIVQMPALATTTSILPSSEAPSVAARCSASWSRTSAVKVTTRPPAASTYLAVSASSSAVPIG